MFDSLKNNPNKRSFWFLISFLLIGNIGLWISVYLTIKHYIGTAPSCIGFSGCEKVFLSSYSTIFNIPVSLIGVGYFLLIMFLAVLYFFYKKENLFNLILLISFFSVIFSAWFVFLQFFEIKALCFWCLISEFCAMVLFILNLLWMRINKIKIGV